MKIFKFFNELAENHDTEMLSNQFASATPLPHLIIDNFLPADIFQELCRDINQFPADKWITKNLGNSIRKESRDFTESYIIQNIITNLTAHSFVNWMSSITNCKEIIPDPHHLGAGLTSASAGAHLGLHVDFNWNDTLKLNRKYNLIIYANETWNDSWNGDLEFWTNDKSKCIFTVKPVPNRLILWEYEQELVHGFTKPLACPANVERQNLMTIYYSSNSTPAILPHKSLFY